MKLKVIPAKGSGSIHLSFTPLNLSESQCESRCVGVALGFLSLDSEVACHGQEKAHFKIQFLENNKTFRGFIPVMCFCVCYRKLFASQVKSEGNRVWIYSLSDWIYKQPLSQRCKQLLCYYLCSPRSLMHPAQFMFPKLK